ncbi:MAG: metallophosphoesterase family protein [Flavobacteriaceae bacterium]
MKKIILLSDTHGFLDQKIKAYVENADEVWHAGDVGKVSILNELEKIKPLRAVFGNIDGHRVRLQAPEIQSFVCEGVNVLMTHIAGYPGRYTSRVKELIQHHQPKLFICGHSHILKVMQDKKNGHLHMNPGAVGISGFHKIRTLLRFDLKKGKIENLEAIELGLRGALSNSINRSN